MKLQIDGVDIYEFEEWQMNVLKFWINADLLDAELKRRAQWVWDHSFEQYYLKLEKEWVERLRRDPSVTMIPSGRKEFAEMVFGRSDYKDKKSRESEDVSAGL